MPERDYKTWIIIALLAVIVGFIVVFFATRSSYKSEPTVRSAERAQPRSAPLIEGKTAEIDKVFSVDELGIADQSAEELSAVGDMYFEAGNYPQAIEIYKRVIEKNPQDIDTYNDLGLAYHYTRQSNIAIDTLRKGTEMNPSFQRVWLSLGFVLMSAGRPEDAKQALQKAVELNPDSIVGKEAQKMIEKLGP